MKIEKDKVQHFIVGFIVSLVIGFILYPVWGFVASVFAGVSKEVWDKFHPKTNTADTKDIAATILGGALAMIIVTLLCL